MNTTPTPDHRTQPPAVPDALLAQWRREAGTFTPCELTDRIAYVANRAAAWAWSQRDEEVREADQRGADAELEACCEWLLLEPSLPDIARELRAARRPAPPTLREQALAALQREAGRDRSSTRGTENDGFVIVTETTLALALQALQEGADG